jgi:D-alanyl-D-alanine dipeptidase
VDDTASAHYNTVIDRGAVPRVDWTSAERMRSIDLYRLGVVVDYNARPIRRGRGSCIFLHIWRAPGSPTSGCTAMPAADLETVVRWLDPARQPTLVQLPEREYARLRRVWALP